VMPVGVGGSRHLLIGCMTGSRARNLDVHVLVVVTGFPRPSYSGT
jgi:hypothetical protein